MLAPRMRVCSERNKIGVLGTFKTGCDGNFGTPKEGVTGRCDRGHCAKREGVKSLVEEGDL